MTILVLSYNVDLLGTNHFTILKEAICKCLKDAFIV